MKVSRDVSGAESAKALQRLGFVITRQVGSHIRLAKGSVRVTVPRHKTILPKTLQSALRQAGVSLEDFLNNL